MTPHDAFLQSIIENPSDAAPRLIYADWLEENGKLDLAEAYRWAAQQRRHPKKCAPGVGWAWVNMGSATALGGSLPILLFLALPKGRSSHDFGSPVENSYSYYHGRRYYHTLSDAYAALAVALKKLKSILRGEREPGWLRLGTKLKTRGIA